MLTVRVASSDRHPRRREGGHPVTDRDGRVQQPEGQRCATPLTEAQVQLQQRAEIQVIEDRRMTGFRRSVRGDQARR